MWNIEVTSQNGKKLEIKFKNGNFEITDVDRDLTVKEVNDLWSMVNMMNQIDYVHMECNKT